MRPVRRLRNEGAVRKLAVTLESAAEGHYRREFRPEIEGDWSIVAARVNEILRIMKSQAGKIQESESGKKHQQK